VWNGATTRLMPDYKRLTTKKPGQLFSGTQAQTMTFCFMEIKESKPQVPSGPSRTTWSRKWGRAVKLHEFLTSARWVLSFTHRQIYPWGRASVIHCIKDYADPRTGPNVVLIMESRSPNTYSHSAELTRLLNTDGNTCNSNTHAFLSEILRDTENGKEGDSSVATSIRQ
jgi:hypothetical protein